MSAYELSVAAETVARAHREIGDAIMVLTLAGHEEEAEELARTASIVDMDVKLLVGARNVARAKAERAGI